MAIDIRASVGCSLGTLISGNLSDDYVQGNGLVKVRGSCEISGIITPKPGAVVTFTYTRDGITTTIPRRVRVLSSFADPFRNTTSVELGCKLTYLESLGPKPEVDDEAANDTGRRQQCLNGYIEYPADSESANGIPIPISAAGVMTRCLTALGITAASNPLTNSFFIEEFDLSAGYVQVLSDLLLSECYFGYLDVNEVLQVVSLREEGGVGPSITRDDLIDLASIGVGQLPGSNVYVRYQALQLAQDQEDDTKAEREDQLNQQASQSDDKWEFESSTAEPTTHLIRYEINGSAVEETYEHTPYSETRTTYGDDDSFDDTVCILYGRDGADLSDKPIRRVTKNRRMLAESAGSYVAQLRAASIPVDPRFIGDEEIRTEYTYNEDGEQILETVRTYLPEFAWVGGIDADFVYGSGDDLEWYVASDDLVLAREVTTEVVLIKAPRPMAMHLQAGEEWVPTVVGSKTTTTSRVNWALSLPGQQTIADIKQNSPFTSVYQLAALLNYAKDNMVTEDVDVSSTRQYGLPSGELRPPATDRLLSSYGKAAGKTDSETETVEELAFVPGGSGDGLARDVVFSMPYQSDDVYSASGTIVPGDASVKAQRFGSIQNRLLLGNRYGVNIQVHPNKVPAEPFAPLYLKSGELSVQYRANGTSWAFSSDGVVASVDALYWGVAGGTGTPWVPVAPGVTNFGPAPAITVNPSTGITESSVAAVIPPWDVTVTLSGISRTRCDVVPYPYPLSTTTDLGVLATRTRALYALRLTADTGYFGVVVNQVNPDPAETGNLVVTGHPASLLHHYVLSAGVGRFFLTPEPDDSYFENWALQHYSFQSELQPVWWAD